MALFPIELSTMPIDHSRLSTQQLAELAWPDPGDAGKTARAYETAYYKPAHPQPAPEQQSAPAPAAAPTASQRRAQAAAMAGDFKAVAGEAWPDTMSITPGDDDADPDAISAEERLAQELAEIESDLEVLLQRKARLEGKAS